MSNNNNNNDDDDFQNPSRTFIDLNEDIPEDDDYILQEETLMASLEPGPRIFIENSDKKSTILGFLLEETEDSFLVALPSKLVIVEDASREGEEPVRYKQIVPYLPVPYCRLLKSSIFAVSYPFSEFKENFDIYLSSEGLNLYPEISEEIHMYLSSLEEAPLPRGEPTSGISMDDLVKKIEEAHSKGGVIPTFGNTKH